ncbi:MAG: ComF family protein [Chlorobi bacterium]|nr:ComF family protein [Chlorobiota bacterium]
MTEKKYNVHILEGNWHIGWALDLHTIEAVGTGAFQRTYLGELLYQIKYRGNLELIDDITHIAVQFLRTRYVLPWLKAIIPIPPSQPRPVQPVIEIANRLGKHLNLPVPLDYLLKKKNTEPLKNINDPKQRIKILSDAFRVSDLRFAGKYILLFDDIYRSGETLKAATSVLMSEGRVKKVFVLTITKTLRNREL